MGFYIGSGACSTRFDMLYDVAPSVKGGIFKFLVPNQRLKERNQGELFTKGTSDYSIFWDNNLFLSFMRILSFEIWQRLESNILVPYLFRLVRQEQTQFF